MKIKPILHTLTGLAGILGGTLMGQARVDLYPVTETAEWRAPVTHLEWRTMTEDNNDALMLSNSPEMVEAPGLLFSGTLKGRGRLFFHHVNDMMPTMRLVIYALAQEETAISVRREIIAEPSKDYMRAGRHLSRQELIAGENVRGVELKAGRPTLLLSKELNLENGELGTGILELETISPVEVRIVMMPKARKAMKYLGFWPTVPADNVHMRGTFKGTERLVAAVPYTPDTDGAVAITLADGTADEFVRGTDELDGAEVRNPGNYGLSYRIRIPSIGTGRYRLYFNPQGGSYAGDIGVQINGRHALLPLAKPARQRAFGAATLRDAIILADVSAGDDVELTWMPAGASFLPIRLWLVPVPEAEEAVAASQIIKK